MLGKMMFPGLFCLQIAKFRPNQAHLLFLLSTAEPPTPNQSIRNLKLLFALRPLSQCIEQQQQQQHEDERSR
jgi:hypothetical protein